MSDDTGITPGHDDGDAEGRDERLGALLAVPPLDDVTRRRLVRTAADAAQPSRARVRLAVAVSVAAVALGAVAAVGLALGGNDDGRPAAAPTTAAKPATRDRTPGGADTESKQQPGAPATEPALPDLGDVTDPATLRQRVLAAPGPARAATSSEAVPCASELRDDGVRDVAAVGEGTDDGRRVVVVTGTRGGAAVAVSVLPSSCDVASEVVLHGD